MCEAQVTMESYEYNAHCIFKTLQPSSFILGIPKQKCSGLFSLAQKTSLICSVWLPPSGFSWRVILKNDS